MGKSLWRNLLASDYYEAAHSKGAPPAVVKNATTAVHDSMQLLRSLDGKGIKTCVALVQAFRSAALDSLRLGSSVKTFVYCFDKYPFVPVSKGVEQMARAATASAAEDASAVAAAAAGADDDDDSAVDAYKELAIGNDLDENWKAHLFDRHFHVPRYIRFIVTQLLIGPPLVRLQLRPDCRVIFDGHYLEDLHVFDEYCDLPERAEEFPFLLQRIPIELAGDGQGDEISFREDLENTIGEGDFAMPFLMSKLAPAEPFIVYSTDSDMVWIFMRFLEKFPAHPGIALFFWPNLSFVVPGKWPAGPGPWQRWWDMNLLRDLIANDKRLSATGNPLRVLEVTCLASGGDYVPYMKMPPQHYVQALFRTPEKFSDLCRANNTISFKPFVELVQAAFSTAQRKEMPSMTALRNCFDNVVHYLDMLGQTARPEGVLYEQNPCVFGYSRVDKTKPLTRDNIKWREDDGTSDACRLLPEHDRTHYGLWPDYPPRTSPLPAKRTQSAPAALLDEDDDSEDDDDDFHSAEDEDSDTVVADVATDDDEEAEEDSDDLSELVGDSSEDDDVDVIIVDDDDDEDEIDSDGGPVLLTAFGAAGRAPPTNKPRNLTVKLSLDGRKHFGTTLQLPDAWPASAVACRHVTAELQRGVKRHLRELVKEEQKQPAPEKRSRKE